MKEGPSYRDLLEMSANLVRGRGEHNPWLVSQVIPPLSLLDKYNDTLEVLKGLSGIEKSKDERKRLWEQLSNLKLPKTFSSYLDRLVKSLESFHGDSLINLECETRTRLLVGIGGSSAWEAGVTSLNPFGIPWIPGSSLKGVVRDYAILNLVNSERDTEHLRMFLGIKKAAGEYKKKPKIEDLSSDEEEIKTALNVWGIQGSFMSEIKLIIELFGTKKREGGAIFYGGFPIDEEVLGVDVINPHYPDYYERGEPPNDWQNPRPFFYPVVREGVSFTFLVALKDEVKDLKDKLEEYLIKTLTEHGVGGKISVGYGLFNCKG